MNWHAFILTHCRPFWLYVLQHNPNLSLGAALLDWSLAWVATSVCSWWTGRYSRRTVSIPVTVTIRIIIVRLLLCISLPITAICVGVFAPASVAVTGHYFDSQSRRLCRFVRAIRFQPDLTQGLVVSCLECWRWCWSLRQPVETWAPAKTPRISMVVFPLDGAEEKNSLVYFYCTPQYNVIQEQMRWMITIKVSAKTWRMRFPSEQLSQTPRISIHFAHTR